MSATKLPSVATSAQRLLKVAIVGLPNAGKSTLINSLMSLVVCPVSKRVHTTRLNQHTSMLHQDTQIVFVDTPGLVNVKEIKKFAFPKEFIYGPEQSLKMADLVAVIHDLSSALTRNKLDPRIRGLLEKFPEKDAILILNKIDTVKPKSVLFDSVRILTSGVVGGRPIKFRKSHQMRVKEEKERMEMNNILERAKKRHEIRTGQFDVDLDDALKNKVLSAFLEEEIREGLHLQGWPKFHDVFMTSAVSSDGVDLLRDYFVANAKSCSWMFNEEFLTDVNPRELTCRIIKSLMLEHLPQEIPYKLTPEVEFWEDNAKTGGLKVIVKLECPSSRYLGRVYGTGGAIIKTLQENTQNVLSNLLQTPVDLVINPIAREKKS